jgi:hypothetical protein
MTHGSTIFFDESITAIFKTNKMKKITNIPAMLFLTLTVALLSCKKGTIRGNGDTIVQQRNINGFTTVQTNADINVYIIYGLTQKVEVKGYSNLVAITETSVSAGKLDIRYKDDYYNVRNSNVEVYISIPVLSGAGTNGSGNIAIAGFTTGADLYASINGSSDINVSNCSYDDARFDVNGSGDIHASGLQAKNAEATVHGSGDIETSCSQNLKARIYGSGDIRYWGNPVLDIAISGSGTVKKQ